MAERQNQGLFHTDSEEDSINTDTTEASEVDSDKDYPVEKLLAQEVGADGQQMYLVKWEGYPLYRCTWEALTTDVHGALLRDWEKEKLAVRRGQKQAFEVDEFNAAYEKWREEVDKKEERRKAKRRRRGHFVPGGEDDFQPVDMDVDSSPKATRVQKTAPVRKGIAQTVREKRTSYVQSGQGLDVSEDDESDASSDGPLTSARRPTATKRQKTSPIQATIQSGSTTQGTSQKKSTKTERASQPTVQPTIASDTSTAPVALKSAKVTTAKDESRLSGARKSAPAPPIEPAPVKQTSTSNVFGENWNAEKQPRPRVRVSGQTPKDSTAPKFTKLSIQNRYQNYGKNEPAPDANALTMFDPKTGRVKPPKLASATKEGRADLHSAYSRRSPPPASKQRSPSVSRSGPVIGETESHSRVTPSSEPPLRQEKPHFEPTSTKHITCKEWLEGTCRYSADECWYAHFVVPGDILPKRYLTCYFWKNQGCKKSVAECEYAHFDTGIYADHPTARKRASIAQGSIVSDSPHTSVVGTAAADTEVSANGAVEETGPLPRSVRDPDRTSITSSSYAVKKGTTCYYWKRGRCIKSAAECDFAHWDTGVYAGEPGSYLDSLRRSETDQEKPNNNPDPRLPTNSATLSNVPSHASDQAPSAAPSAAAHEPTPPAPMPYALTETEKAVDPATLITDTPMRDSPVNEVTNRMAPRSPFTGNASMISPSKDPRRQARMRESAASPGERPPSSRTPSLPEHLLRDDVEMARSGIGKIDFISLLGAKHSAIKNVFIHMSKDRQGEVDILRKYFEKFNCEVLTDPVTWGFFRKTHGKAEQGSLVVVHPSELFYGTMPKLHEFIMDAKAAPRIFSIGIQHELCLREHRPPTYEARRFFPLGGMTFISDDVFVYYPEKATEIIDLFLEQTKHKPPGAETFKIGARPGIKTWMLRLANRKFDESDGQGKGTDVRWIRCYEALCRLCPLQDEDPYYPQHSVPLESSHLWSSWEGSMPSFKGRWESGDEAGATAYMVNHFAAEAVSKVWKYRKFWFVYQRPKDAKSSVPSGQTGSPQVPHDPATWTSYYNHIGIYTPDEVLSFMRKR